MSEEEKKRKLLDEETEEEIEEEMEQGDAEADPYTEEGLDVLTDEEDEMASEEEGFMEGYNKALNEENDVECAHCSQMIVEEEEIVRNIDGKIRKFCSEECADEYEESRE